MGSLALFCRLIVEMAEKHINFFYKTEEADKLYKKLVSTGSFVDRQRLYDAVMANPRFPFKERDTVLGQSFSHEMLFDDVDHTWLGIIISHILSGKELTEEQVHTMYDIYIDEIKKILANPSLHYQYQYPHGYVRTMPPVLPSARPPPVPAAARATPAAAPGLVNPLQTAAEAASLSPPAAVGFNPIARFLRWVSPPVAAAAPAAAAPAAAAPAAAAPAATAAAATAVMNPLAKPRGGLRKRRSSRKVKKSRKANKSRRRT